MRHWSQLGTRNWRAKPARTLLATTAIALGVAVVVWVTGCYESVRRTITEVVLEWIGRAHVTVESVAGRWGHFSDELASQIGDLPEVREVATRTMEWVEGLVPDEYGISKDGHVWKLEITGIDPLREQRFRTHRLAMRDGKPRGRLLEAGDRGVVLAESALATQLNFDVGDTLRLDQPGDGDPQTEFKVVGLIERRRAAAQQLSMIWAPLADVQALYETPGRVKGVDIIVRDTSPEGIRRAVEQIRPLVEAQRDNQGNKLKISTTEAQLAKLNAAQGLLRFILMLCACVLLLTAFFIIAATMSMGVVERVSQIGLMRCVGAVRRQVAAVVLIESLPVGLAGVIVGVPAGWALQHLTLWLVPEYIGTLAYSTWGHVAAVTGGLGTTILGALLPAARAISISPVEATRPLAHPQHRAWIIAAAAAGGALLLLNWIVLRTSQGGSERFDAWAITAVIALYAGYTLIAPAAVLGLSRLVVHVTALALRLRPQLLGDEIARSPWRSASICSGLMVGLSLIVGLSVWAESVKAGWQFPREFPEGLLYSWSGVTFEKAQQIKREGVPGVKDFVIADDFEFNLRRPGPFNVLKVLEKFHRFVAVGPDDIPIVISLSYLEGNERDAMARLRAGGHIFITREFSQANDKHLNDKVTFYAEGKSAEFTVAAVIGSPALDIAVNFFNATEYFQVYAVGAVIGTLQDAREKFGRDQAKLFLFNFDLSNEQIAATLPGEAGDNPASIAAQPEEDAGPEPEEHPWFSLDANLSVASPAEEAVVNDLKKRLEKGPFAFATAAQLKREIDNSLDNVIHLLSAVPLVGLLVAALGVGNLMMANVAARRRQIAVLRAIGTTRGQVLRMIVGEAMILGLLGSGVGLLLGLHLGYTSNTLTEALSGFRPEFTMPWALLAGGAALAIGLCVLAGLVPARRASRGNIVAALQYG